MLTTNQLNILTQSIQQRNETGEPSLAKDVFEVFKKVAQDYQFWYENDMEVDTLDKTDDEIFEEFMSQYNPQS